MYIPSSMEASLDTCLSLIDRIGFGILSSSEKNVVEASHLPFYYERTNKDIVLYTHLARVNNHWHSIDGTKVLVIFQGPHAFISPYWYRPGLAVPTWNYAAVHVSGICKVLDKENTKLAVHNLLAKYEPGLINNDAILPKHFFDKLLNAIVGLEIRVEEIKGVLKLGQNRSSDDLEGILKGLKSSDTFSDLALAELMTDYLPGLKKE